MNQYRELVNTLGQAGMHPCAWCGKHTDMSRYHPTQNAICDECAVGFARVNTRSKRTRFGSLLASLIRIKQLVGERPSR